MDRFQRTRLSEPIRQCLPQPNRHDGLSPVQLMTPLHSEDGPHVLLWILRLVSTRTATEGGRLAVQEPGVPGKDNFIEYQDARDFLAAADELLRVPPPVELTADGRAAFDKLRNEIFATLDPSDPNHPLPAS